MKKVIGKEKVDYVSKKTGEPVKGMTLYLSYSDDRIVGVGSEKAFVSEKSEGFTVACDVSLGQDVNVYYNRFGSVEAVVPVMIKKA